MRGSLRRLVIAPMVLAAAAAAWVEPVSAQTQRQRSSVTATGDVAADPTTQLNNDLKETQDRLHAFEAENEALRRRNELNEKTIRALTESLAVANAESEVFKRQYGELKLRMEALGLASVGDNKEALEQRLLKAVRDLDLTRQEKDKLAERLVALSETVLLALKTANVSDPQIRMEVEEQLRSANQSLDTSNAERPAAASEPAADLKNGQVISVKEEYGLLVVNLGSKQGVKVGMPFQIVRSDHAVGRARVVDVRERICGAVIEEFSSNIEKVKVGDQLRVDAEP
jgi:cell shape-determining protein MreC